MRVVLVVQSLIIAGLIFYTLSLQQQLERLQAVTTLPQTTQAEPQPVQVTEITQTAVAQDLPATSGDNRAKAVQPNLPAAKTLTETEQPEEEAAEPVATAQVSTDAATDFGDQQIDFSWAPEFSSQLGVMFQQSELLHNLKVKDIECRHSLCRVQIYNEDQDALRLGVSIGSALEASGFTDHAYQFATQSENGVFTVYVGRDKNSIQLK